MTNLFQDIRYAVRMLARAAPGVQIGHDPCHGHLADALRRDRDFGAFVKAALAESPEATMIYLAIPIVLAAEVHGCNLVAAFQAAGRRVDARAAPDERVLTGQRRGHHAPTDRLENIGLAKIGDEHAK